MDQPVGCRVRLVQQRGDPPRSGVSAHVPGPGPLAWRLGTHPAGAAAPRAGGRIKRLLSIFANPKLPSISDYYEPWTYEYEHLLTAPAGEHTPVARPKSLISGKDTKISWSANWDDSLAGGNEIAAGDPILARVSETVRQEYEKAFMFFLPRICEHCLNPSCAASCPSGAIYKRSEDGIVLVDSDRCRGWRMCVTGCPYKKIYFNHRTGKAEKCTFCFPRVEIGIPTVCSETCVGRLRYIGLMLYDADAVQRAASVERETDLYAAQRSVFLDPRDPAVLAAARQAGIAEDWISAAQRSPIWDLINHVRGRAAPASRVPHHADGLVHPAAVTGRGRPAGHRP